MNRQRFGGQEIEVCTPICFDLLDYPDKSFTSLLLCSLSIYWYWEVFVQRNDLTVCLKSFRCNRSSSVTWASRSYFHLNNNNFKPAIIPFLRNRLKVQGNAGNLSTFCPHPGDAVGRPLGTITAPRLPQHKGRTERRMSTLYPGYLCQSSSCRLCVKAAFARSKERTICSVPLWKMINCVVIP